MLWGEPGQGHVVVSFRLIALPAGATSRAPVFTFATDAYANRCTEFLRLSYGTGALVTCCVVAS